MALSFPAAVKARLAASGGGAAVSMLDVVTITGQHLCWSDSDITAPSGLPVFVVEGSGIGSRTIWTYPATPYLPWLLSAGPFKSYSNTTTSTGQVTVQNLSGDTVRRDISLLFSQSAMMGAMVFFRTWLADCEYATFAFMGTVTDVELEAMAPQ